MTNKIEFELFDNAIDSLNEALLKYIEGEEGNYKAYKFCILHFSHFLELLFKYYVYKSHPLLIYKNPFAKKLDYDSYTIGLSEAIQFIKNEGKDISKRLSSDLDWIKKLRNSIEHHKFSMNILEVQETIGRLMRAVSEFNDLNGDIQIDKHLDNIDVYDTFHRLSNTYKHRLNEAEKLTFLADDEAKKQGYEFEIELCPKCREYTFITDKNSTTGFCCTFCGNTDIKDL